MFAKALASDASNLVINQPGPFQHGFWATITEDFSKPLVANQRNLDSFSKLLLLMSRRRQAGQETVVVKFISWNALYVDFIMKAFPDVPAIFLYRDPVEIIASVRNSATAILEAKDRRQAEFLTGLERSKIDQIGATEYLAICYRRSFETMTAWRDDRLSFLDYSELARDRFTDILARSFGLRPEPPAVETMLAQFGTYSKDDSNRQSFSEDREHKRNAINETDTALITDITSRALMRLRQDRRNLFLPSAALSGLPRASTAGRNASRRLPALDRL